MPEEIPVELRSFLTENIESVAQLELLLLLRQEAERAWPVSAAAQALYISEEMTTPLLSRLRTTGLLATDAEGRFRFAPQTPQLARLADELAELYQLRRVTVIGLIHSAPVNKLRTFADAFRLRPPKEDN
jgi:hypothetical protein